MTLRHVAIVVVPLLLAAAVGSVTAKQEDPFQHEKHQGLFPVCTGCHEGAETGVEADLYPDPELCVNCHDGVDEGTVEWNGRADPIGNVTYDHVVHAEEMDAAGDPPATCETCHSAAEDRMMVDAEEELDACWSCHAHEAEKHYEDAACDVCHVPLAETEFDLPRIELLPLPEDHDEAVFLPEMHGRLAEEDARCATCHTVERCLSCHVDGDRPQIEAVPSAPEGMRLPVAHATYPVPASHIDEGWFDEHGGQAAVRECSTCHTTDDCRTCHVGTVPDLVEALPARGQVVAPGVGLETQAPQSHESLLFTEAHSTLAAADEQSCATCHTESYCVECHDGPPVGGYHPVDFIARHSATAFGRDDECAACHNTAVFCRQCHVESGLGSTGRLGFGYHDAEPLWLLRHGGAARQNLESCASCHEQNDCVQCHGTLGAFQVSPHSRDFDADAAWARNPRTCMACHVRRPVGGGDR